MLKMGYTPFCESVLLVTNADPRMETFPKFANFASFEPFLNRNTGLQFIHEQKRTLTASDIRLVKSNRISLM